MIHHALDTFWAIVHSVGRRTDMTVHEHNLLVISDLHLGEGIRDDDASSRERLMRVDRELQDFIAHYTAHRRGGRPWRLVINGDMVDFIAVCLMPARAEGLTELHPDDHIYGLGTRAHAAAVKMKRVLEHHDETFRALARFVGRGNALSLVIGNHDAEFHWPVVQRLLREALVQRWREEPDREGQRSAEEVADAIRFYPWFYLEPGVAWIEHGHQYDPYCSFESVLDPSSGAPDLDVNIGAALVRYVTNPFTLNVSEHWGNGFWGYLRFWAGQGFLGAAAILLAYRDMVLRLFWDWHARRRRADKRARRQRVRARLARVARGARVPITVLRRLLSLHRAPVILDFGRIMRAIMLDRLLVLLAAPLFLLVPLTVASWSWLPVAILLSMVGFVALVRVAAREREPVDPQAQFSRVSGLIRKIARVPIVVFGHSHQALAEGHEGAMYFNTGTWMPHNELRAFTHVMIERTERGIRARLCQWRDGASRVYEAREGVKIAASTSRVTA